jgi:hypothetical protein
MIGSRPAAKSLRDLAVPLECDVFLRNLFRHLAGTLQTSLAMVKRPASSASSARRKRIGFIIDRLAHQQRLSRL